MCGTGDGILNLFSWGEWGDISDRFPGHPLSIDSCVAVSDNVVCTGSMDGIIRYALAFTKLSYLHVQVISITWFGKVMGWLESIHSSTCIV